ncbi:MAG: DNA-processing protein DprA [Acidobacteriota bacterium]|nr:MAG: DNA-processing protein DprA [Acidobacteriota bacterium]
MAFQTPALSNGAERNGKRMDDLASLMALHSVEGVGDTFLRRLLDEFETPKAVFRASVKELLRVERLPEKTARAVRSGRGEAEREAERRVAAAKKAGARILAWHEESYPRLLKEMDDFPSFLYVRGDADVLAQERAMAVVGTRRATSYGKKMAHDVAFELARRGVSIVSGLARGVDSAAHRAALEAEGGTTVAVLGCGIDRAYPPENRDLMTEITKRGAVVTEFPPGAPPESTHFPKRNRIIAGLGQGVLVVEAPRRSGALITAKWAEEYNRSVFAVPGPATSPASQGCNLLLKKGAVLVETWEDIAADLPVLGLEAGEERKDGAAPKVEFTVSEEEAIYEYLSPADPVHIDSLALKTGFSISTLLTHLLSMEIRDVVEQLPGKLFLRKA